MEDGKNSMHSDLVIEDNIDESMIEMFIKQNKETIDCISTRNDDTNLFSKIVNLVTNVIEYIHDQGRDRLFFPNISEIQKHNTTIRFKKLDNEIKNILNENNLRYNHCIFGHRISNVVFSLINIAQMAQYINEKADLAWNSNNKIKSNSEKCVTLIHSMTKNTHNDEKQQKSNKDSNNNSKQRKKGNNNNQNKSKMQKSTSSTNSTNNNTDHNESDNSNNENGESEDDDIDIKTVEKKKMKDKEAHNKQCDTDPSTIELNNLIELIHDQINEGSQFVDQIRAMNTVLMEVVKSLTRNGTIDSIDYFHELENNGAILTYVIHKLMQKQELLSNTAIQSMEEKLRDEQKHEAQLQGEVKEKQQQIQKLQKEKENLQKQLNNKQQEICDMQLAELEREAQRICCNESPKSDNDDESNVEINDQISDIFGQGEEQLSPILPSRNINNNKKEKNGFNDFINKILH